MYSDMPPHSCNDCLPEGLLRRQRLLKKRHKEMGVGRQDDYLLQDSWSGVLSGHPRPFAETQIFAVARVADTGSVPFLGLAMDGNSYWVKYLGNAHGIDSLVAERVVEALARKLSAPMRPSMLVDVPPSLLHHPGLSTSGIQAGVAHGSLLLDTCQEKTVLDSAGRDGNAARQPRFIALWELCYGEDGQWLYDRSGEEQVWSFDHGYWITGGEPAPLTPADLLVTVNQKRPWYGPVRGMDPGAFLGVADDLESLSVADFIDVVASVPVAWGVPDSLLEALAWWLHFRRAHVVTRMRALATEAAKTARPS